MEEDKDENLVAHLEALRSMLIRCLTAIAVGLVPMILIAPYFLDWLIKTIIADSPVTLNFFSPAEVFILQIKLAVVLDLAVCFPYIAKQVWNFVLPALYDNERRFIRSIVLVSSLLFCTGVVFCIFLILPLIIKFGVSFSSEDLKAVFGISNVIGLSLWLAVAFGIMFQFPLVTYSLIRSGIASYEAVKSKRRYIFIAILVVAAFLTPPDIVSQLLLALPTYGLFEGGLYFARRIKPNE